MSTFLIFLSFMVPGTIAIGFYDVITKRLLSSKVDERLILSINMFGVSAIGFLVLGVFGFPEILNGFWPAFAGTATLNIFGQWFWYKAMQAEDVSIISPMRLLMPPLVLVTGFLLLKEVPTLLSVAGVFTVLVGLWFLLNKRPSIISFEFKNVLKRPGIIFALLSVFFFSISFPLDKQALLASSAIFTITLAGFVIGFANLLFGFASARCSRSFFFVPREIRLWIPISIIVYVLAAGLTLHSLQYTLVGYASSVKRLSSLWAVIFARSFLKEKYTQRRIVAVIIMFLGIALIVIGG